MNKNWKRYASFGLYLSGLAFLATFGWYIVRREADLYFNIGLGLTVLGLAASVLLDPDGARKFLTGRQARYGSNAIIITLAFLGLLIVINYIVYQNDRSWDLTEDKQNTLAPETINALQGLSDPVVAQAFITGRQSFDFAENLLKLYQRDSKDKFRYEVINPETAPELAKQANITRDGDIVLFMGDRQEKVTVISEEGITGALIRLISTGVRKVYFLTGHGEHSLDSTTENGYSELKRKLESKNYQVGTLNLLTVPAVPEDASAIIVGGPQKPLNEGEIKVIEAYVSQGGVLIALVEPTLMSDFGGSPDLLASYLNSTWGISLANDLIVDLVGAQTYNLPLLAVGSSFGSHPITNGIADFATIFPTARSIDVSQGETGTSPVLLVSTSQNSWGETDLTGVGKGEPAQPDQAVDKLGPVWLGAAAENFNNKARIVVFGDSDFVGDRYIQEYGNGDLFVNSVDWATGQEDLISLTPKSSTTRVLKITPSLYTKGLVLLVSLFILPSLPIIAAIYVIIQRRKS